MHFSQTTVRRRGRSGAGRDSVTRCVTGRHKLWRNAGHRDRGAGTTRGKNYQNLPVNGLSLCLTREWLQMHGHYVHPGTGLCCVSYTLHSRCWQIHIYNFLSVTMCYDCNLTLHFGRQKHQPKGRDWLALFVSNNSEQHDISTLNLSENCTTLCCCLLNHFRVKNFPSKQ